MIRISKELQDKGIIGSSDCTIEKLKSGTTEGLVYLLSEGNKPKYILKRDTPTQINLTSQFLTTYKHVTLFPNILYTAHDKEYILYSYVEGTTHYNRGSKIDWMTILVKEVFSQYKQADKHLQWGRLEGEPRNTWLDFNRSSLESALLNAENLLPHEDYDKVKAIAERLAKNEQQEEKYLLHGDTGVHNFVFHNNRIVGVIDPSPIIGPILYDFTYSFCSSPDDLNVETLLSSFAAFENFTIDKERLIDEVILQLYTRIGICAKVHPHDLEDYLKAWEYWRLFLVDRKP